MPPVDLTPDDDRPAGPETLGSTERAGRYQFPDAGAPGPELGPEEEVGPPFGEPEARATLDDLGTLLNGLLPTPVPNMWKFQPEEIDRLAPAMVKIVHRFPVVARVLRRAALLVLVLGVIRWASRNVALLRAAEEAERQAADAPPPEADAEPGDPARGPGSFGMVAP